MPKEDSYLQLKNLQIKTIQNTQDSPKTKGGWGAYFRHTCCNLFFILAVFLDAILHCTNRAVRVLRSRYFEVSQLLSFSVALWRDFRAGLCSKQKKNNDNFNKNQFQV